MSPIPPESEPAENNQPEKPAQTNFFGNLGVTPWWEDDAMTPEEEAEIQALTEEDPEAGINQWHLSQRRGLKGGNQAAKMDGPRARQIHQEWLTSQPWYRTPAERRAELLQLAEDSVTFLRMIGIYDLIASPNELSAEDIAHIQEVIAQSYQHRSDDQSSEGITTYGSPEAYARDKALPDHKRRKRRW